MEINIRKIIENIWSKGWKIIKDLNKTINKLLSVIEKYDKASQKFINKVETGKARSVETYNDLKKCQDFKNKILINFIKERDD